jgi:hypothetical protein
MIIGCCSLLGDTAQTKAHTQPIKVHPKNKFIRKTPPILLEPTNNAIIVGKK